MLVKDEGIVLSVSRSGDTSLGVVFLGRASGKIRLLAKGALSPKYPGRGVLESGNQVEVVYYHKDGYSTFYLKEVSLVASPAAGRESLPHLAANLAALELLSHVKNSRLTKPPPSGPHFVAQPLGPFSQAKSFT